MRMLAEQTMVGQHLKHLRRRGGAVIAVLLLHAGLLQVLLSGHATQTPEATPPALAVALLPPPEPPKLVKPPTPPKMVRTPPPPQPLPPKQEPSPVVSDAGLATPLPAPPAPPVAAPPAPPPQHLAAQVDATVTCRAPDYPMASRRAGETGTVRLQFLVDQDGKVVDSRIESSSGYARLDEAARDALTLCHFIPGTVDGRPERSWARLDYVWKLR